MSITPQLKEQSQEYSQLADYLTLNEVLERISDAFIALDDKWRYTYMNKKAGEISNRDPGRIIGKHIWTEFPEEIDRPFYKACHEAMESQSYICLEDYYQPYDLWFENHIYPSPGGLSIFFKDITEKKNAEQMILESKRRYETLTDISPVGIFHTDATGFTTYVNKRWCQISGLSFEEALGDGWFKAVHKDDRERLVEDWRAASKLGKTSLSEYRFIRPDGEVAWVMGHATPEKNFEDQIIGYVGTTTDITERKKTEEALNQNRIFIESIINASPDIIYIYDIEQNKNVYVNQEIEKSLGYSDDEIKKMGNQLVATLMHPSDFERYIENVYPKYATTPDKEIITNEYRLRDKAGDWHWYYCRESIFLRRDDGTPVQIFGIITDITERKELEQARGESEEKYRTLVEQASDAIFLFDHNGNFLDLNSSAVKLSGYTRDELFQHTIYELSEENDLKEKPFLFQQLMEGHTINNERKLKRKDGTILDVEVSTKLLTDGRFQSFARDITDRKKAEEQILREKILSDSIINSLPGLFYLYDSTGKFIRWNKNVEAISGYTSKEVEQMHPLDFFFEDEKELLREKIAEVFEKGMADVEACFYTKDHRKIPYYFNGWRVMFEGKECLIGVGIDITERKKTEEELKQTSEQLRKLTAYLQNIRDQERKRIGREIHDELGQQLTAIKMDVAWIDKKTSDESTVIKTKLKNIINLLDTSNLSVRKILHELRADILDNHGLKNALEWQGRQFTATTGIPLNFECSENIMPLDEAVSNCIFRVFQEALTNITKYAEAKKVESSLYFNENKLRLEIKDDGKGFDPALLKSPHTFGILGIKERVTSLRGKFDLVSSPGHGTKISIAIPL